jgi:hypothetical protein
VSIARSGAALSVIDIYGWERPHVRLMYEKLFGAYDRVNLDPSSHASRNPSLSFLRRRSLVLGDSL